MTKSNETTESEPKRHSSGSALNCLVMPEDLEVINNQDDVTLAQWACMLNKWEWPEELPNEDKSHETQDYKTGGRRSQLRTLMEDRVGHRLVSWEWNKENMTIEEFNDFYAGTFEGDKEAKARYDKRLNERYGFEA